MAYQNNLIVRDILVVSDFFHLKNATMTILVHIPLHGCPIVSLG